MKKQFKKLVTLICAMVMAISLIPTTAGAARVGDVVGYAQPTDIVATINGYQLESYNVNGLTYICVEDLRYYGFNVTYDNYTRTLGVTRSYYAWIDPQNTNPGFWSIGSNTKRTNILHTDIGTYLDGSWVGSSNINGKTIINFNELSRYGTTSYDNNRREISLVLSDVNYNQLALLAPEIEADETDNLWNARVRAKGNVLSIIYTSKTIDYLSEVNNQWSFSNRVTSGDLYSYYKEGIDAIKSSGIDISSIYVQYLTGSGQNIVSTQIY